MKDYLGYKDKVCVITGAASGMGKAATEMLVDLGAKVYAMDINEVKTPGVSEAIQVNLAEKESIDTAFEKVPETIDSFFGCAGLSGVHTDWYTTFTVNFIANKYITEAYVDKRMPRGGAIVYIASVGGMWWDKYSKEYQRILKADTWEDMIRVMKKLAPPHGFAPLGYVLTKRALNAYAAKKAGYFAGKGIRINTIMPGGTATALEKDFDYASGGNLLNFCGYAGRLAQPREMAEPLVFLNSDMASYITGVHLPVDYGLKEKKSDTKRRVNRRIMHTTLVQNYIRKNIEKGHKPL